MRLRIRSLDVSGGQNSETIFLGDIHLSPHATSSLDSASRTPRSSWWRLGSSKHRFVFKPSSQRGSQLALSSSESRAPVRGTLTT